MTHDENDEFNFGFGVFEDRPRDPAWLTESMAERYQYERGECCWDQVRSICEVPRVRVQGAKRTEMPPARFRLCRHHTLLLLEGDPDARVFWLEEK